MDINLLSQTQNTERRTETTTMATMERDRGREMHGYRNKRRIIFTMRCVH